MPKCGGITFSRILKFWFHFGYHLHYYDHKKNMPPRISNFKLRYARYLPICIDGHFIRDSAYSIDILYPQVQQFITFITF